MLPLKLVRSLVLGDSITSNPLHLSHQNVYHFDGDDDDNDDNRREKRKPTRRARSRTKSDENIRRSKNSLLFFVPTREFIADTYRLATIARDMGMDLYPTPSLSHIIFSFPSPSSSASPSSASPSPPSFSSSHPSSWSSVSLSSSLSWSLPNDAVLLSFPSLSASSLSHLRAFVSLSRGLFKLVFVTTEKPINGFELGSHGSISNWDCCSVSLFSQVTGDRIDSMEAFSRALAGTGWTLYKTKKNAPPDSDDGCGGRGGNSVYLFRKVYSGRVRVRNGSGECRVRELRLPPLDFRNAPLRILQYLVLMTDDVFFLA